MLLHLPDILKPAEIQQAREILARAPWGSGRITAGEQSAQAKHNEQLPETSPETRELQTLVLAGLERHAVFFSATLPKQISPPLFNRYGGTTNHFGNHVDSAVRYLRNGAGRVRTDISCTLFLSALEDYDGGELVIENTGGQQQRVKLPAGHMVIYPGTSVHRVDPVTRGHRLASFFWIQSMVRSSEHRQLLFDMDAHLIRLRSTIGETDASVIGLTGTYHNLLRTWLDV
ncbi:Fe2+-dependent dioxygenase [Polaromonas eurypsychrophila]|uniref:PKHD-type hydroxylase n=1 Tax=Polaromonas eurypsychrophila TaxID=1614635 RepID=A0A916SNZ1_9BURK|nr:Fe2+-dependent dioxygenase [Polaromonas eurypsychrophila]GGB08482.1 PKHD-type hydroxylase [Polaromonas eurypsychrophila]